MYNGINELSYLEKLLLVYTEYDIKTCEDIGKGDKFMEEFIKDATDASHDEDVKAAYDKEWETRLWGFEEGRFEGRERGREEGLKEGLKEGRKKGIEEGIEEGIKEGIKEGHKKGREEGIKEIVINMLKKDVSIKDIMLYTNVSEKEINKIKKDVKN